MFLPRRTRLVVALLGKKPTTSSAITVGNQVMFKRLAKGRRSASNVTRQDMCRPCALQRPGFGRGGTGFFYFEIPKELQKVAFNSALVYIDSGNLSTAQVEAEFKELVDEGWEWQVRKLSATDYAIVFPSEESLRMAIRGGGICLPMCKHKALVLESAVDPQASEVLTKVWVRLHGVPSPLHHVDRLL